MILCCHCGIKIQIIIKTKLQFNMLPSRKKIAEKNQVFPLLSLINFISICRYDYMFNSWLIVLPCWNMGLSYSRMHFEYLHVLQIRVLLHYLHYTLIVPTLTLGDKTRCLKSFLRVRLQPTARVRTLQKRMRI